MRTIAVVMLFGATLASGCEDASPDPDRDASSDFDGGDVDAEVDGAEPDGDGQVDSPPNAHVALDATDAANGSSDDAATLGDALSALNDTDALDATNTTSHDGATDATSVYDAGAEADSAVDGGAPGSVRCLLARSVADDSLLVVPGHTEQLTLFANTLLGSDSRGGWSIWSRSTVP
jgi:hypothetical protein